MRQQKELIDIFEFDIFAHTEKNKDADRPFWRYQTLVWREYNSFFPSCSKSFSRMHMKIVTSMFLPTFSYPATILLIPSCGIWNTDTAKKPRGKLFHENMQYTLSSSKQLQIHTENPHSSSEDRKETGSIPFSVMLCFSCSKIQNFLNYFELWQSIPFQKAWNQKKKKK